MEISNRIKVCILKIKKIVLSELIINKKCFYFSDCIIKNSLYFKMQLRNIANDSSNYLDGLKKDLVQLINNLVHLCNTHNQQQLIWCGRTDQWSILQHLEHIHLHNVSFIEKSFNSLNDLPTRPDQNSISQPFRHSSSGSLYINSISPDSQLKMRALPNFVPTGKLDRLKTLKRLKTSTDEMFKLIEESRLINLNNIRLTIPGCNLVFYLGDVLQIIIQHTNRHVKQINTLVSNPAFPN